jgi:5-amino-6-(5-phospho-D-ribitylamino)uracil phosphatase
MSCRYELLAIDLDGTLLNRRGEVSRRNREAIATARAAGLEVVIATGRAWIESRHVLEALGHEGLVVAAGGSLLCDGVSGRTIDRRSLPHHFVEEITHSLVSHGHKVLILKDAHATGYDYLAVGEGDLDPASRWWFDQLPVKVRFANDLADDIHPLDSLRAGAVACESRLAPLARSMRDALAGRCCMQHWSAVTETHATGSRTHLLEIFTHNVNKWTMIEACCRQRGVDVQRVAAIGDGLNDVELIANAGVGIAMGNAGDEVMAVADRVTVDHNDDGVAVAIDRLLAGTW